MATLGIIEILIILGVVWGVAHLFYRQSIKSSTGHHTSPREACAQTSLERRNLPVKR